jgi:hypothetical protein
LRYFAFAVFGLHVVAETVFGLRGFLAGGFSWQAGVDVGALAPQIAGSARFLASGLLTLAVLGAWVVFRAGVGSAAGRAVAVILAFFHCLGAFGIVMTAASYDGFLSTTNAQGAFGIHALLGAGFGLVALLHGRIRA